MTAQNLHDDAIKNNIIAENRCGKFYMSWELIRQNDSKLLMNLMSNFLIVRAEAMFASDAIEYCAYSPLFEPKAPYAITPTYTICLDSDFNVTVNCVKG